MDNTCLLEMARESESNEIIVHFTARMLPLLQVSVSFVINCTTVPLKLVTMQSYPLTLEISNFCLFIEINFKIVIFHRNFIFFIMKCQTMVLFVILLIKLESNLYSFPCTIYLIFVDHRLRNTAAVEFNINLS